MASARRGKPGLDKETPGAIPLPFLRNFGMSCPKTVLDIGGSHGQFAQEIFRTFAEAVIYSFEPIPECFEELQALSELHPTLRPIQLALSDREGEAKFQISKFRDSSSLQEMLPAHTEAWPNTETETTTTVRISRLDEVAPQLKLEPPVFAKLDVQGHELAVIRGGRETLSRCQRVMTPAGPVASASSDDIVSRTRHEPRKAPLSVYFSVARLKGGTRLIEQCPIIREWEIGAIFLWMNRNVPNISWRLGLLSNSSFQNLLAFGGLSNESAA